jgi:hypothetical protein
MIKTIFKLYSKYYRWYCPSNGVPVYRKSENAINFVLATIEKGMKLDKEHVCRVQEKKNLLWGHN